MLSFCFPQNFTFDILKSKGKGWVVFFCMQQGRDSTEGMGGRDGREGRRAREREGRVHCYHHNHVTVVSWCWHGGRSNGQ